MSTATESKVKSKAFKVKVSTSSVDGERTITAVVSSSSVDRDYEQVDVPSLRLPLKGGGYVRASELTGSEPIDIPMLINHSFDVEDVIGSVRSAYLDDAGELVVVFGISGRAKAQDLMMLIDEKHLDNAFSITMNDYEWSDMTIFDAEIVEISLVFRGSNKDARVLAVKSLIKGVDMTEKVTKSELEAKRKALDEEIAALDSAEEPVDNEAKPVEGEEQKPVEGDKKEPTAEEEAEAAKVAEAEAKEKALNEAEIKSKQEKKNMTEAQKVAAAGIKKAPVEGEVLQPVSVKKVSKKEIRELFVQQFKAAVDKDQSRIAQLNAKAMELRGLKTDGTNSKAISYADGSSLYQDVVVSEDILTQYQTYGNLGALVNKIDILGATKWKRIIETNGNGFEPVGKGATKPEDKPVWSNLLVNPHEHALIVAWFDSVAKETPIAVYNQIIKYIARMYAKLEDSIVLTFAGGTFSGEVFESTGLIPALEGDDRVVEVGGYTGAEIVAALGEAFGDIESDGDMTIVANKKTWGKMAVAVNANGNTVFNVVGNQVQAGALGVFNVALSQAAPDDKAVIGVFDDYDLVTRGALEQLFSREATVGSVNLFTQDASAVRSNIDISGGAARIESFVELDFATS